MKKIFTVSLCVLLIQLSFGQNIGLRVNTEFSDNRKINNSLGVGGYLNINNFSKKVELIFSLDFNRNSKKFLDEEFKSTYTRFYFTAGGMYVFSLKEKTKIKIGPSFSYNVINATDGGLISNWINPYKTKSIGTELMTNIHFQEIFKLPINFDIFITPTYLINIKNENNLSSMETGSDYSENLKILNIQMGLSYKIK